MTDANPALRVEPMGDDAFHGLAGDIVQILQEHSEASSEALLAPFLVIAGNYFGRTPVFPTGAMEQRCNLHCALVGTTGSRKSTAVKTVQWLFTHLGMDLPKDRFFQGLVSGETIRLAASHSAAQVYFHDDLGSLLSEHRRTLSSTLRSAWDGTTFSLHPGAEIVNPHIGIIVGATPGELRWLSSLEPAAGLCSRFLWIHSRRAATIPTGAHPEAVSARLLPYVSDLRAAIDFVEARAPRYEYSRDVAAEELWVDLYHDLQKIASRDNGLFRRAATQIVRLSMVYAILDRAHVIKPPHLTAALAVWRHCESIVRVCLNN